MSTACVNEERMTPFGIYSLMMVFGLFSCLIYSQYTANPTAPVSYAVSGLIVLPLAVLSAALLSAASRKRADRKNGLFYTIVYTLFLTFIACVMLTQFSLFLASFTHLSLRFAGFITVLLLSALYAARRGSVNLCRCAVVFFIVNTALSLISCFLLAFRIRRENLTPLPLDFGGVVRSIPRSVSQLMPLPALFAFRKKLPEKTLKPLFAFCLSFTAASALTSVISLGVLGEYSQLVRFPFYTASQAVGIGAFQRLDIIFLAARVVEMFTALSIIFSGVGELSEEISYGSSPKKYVMAASAAASGAAVFFSLQYESFRNALLSEGILLLTAVIFAFAAPIITLLRSLLGSEVRLRAARGTALVLAAAVLIPLLSGCANVQLQDRMIIKALGFDRDSGGYLVTAQYIDNFSDGNRQLNKVAEARGKSVSEAVGRFKDITGSEPFLGQNSTVVLGSGAVSGLESGILDYLVRYSESRPTVRLYVSTTTASDILNISSDGETTPIDRLTRISPSGSHNDNQFTVLSLTNQILSGFQTPTAAAAEADDSTLRLKNAAYISDGKLNLLGDDDYLAYLMLTAVDSEAVVTCGDISCGTVRCIVKKRGSFSGGRLTFDVECKPELSAEENPRQLSDGQIENIFDDYLTELLLLSCRKMISENGCDIYGLWRSLSASELRLIGNDYGDLLKNAELRISVHCHVSEAKSLE